MTRPFPQTAAVLLLLTAAATGAMAHGSIECAAIPKDEKKPQMELQRKLESTGWRVRQVRNYNGCYEVYGFDAKGRKAEAFFDPKSLDRVYPEGEKAEDSK